MNATIIKFPSGEVAAKGVRYPTHLLDDAGWMTGYAKQWRACGVSIWAEECRVWRWGCKNLTTGDSYIHPKRYESLEQSRQSAWRYLSSAEDSMIDDIDDEVRAAVIVLA